MSANIGHSGESAVKLAAVTPSDSVNFSNGPCRALWVGTGGNVAVLAAQDSAAVVIANVPDGARLDIAALRVDATNTTASNIVAWW
ncbi:MAG: hypothetical protein KDE50_20960 [Caldilineaceae bacterium]|nr:hypothetical protein [Caldilineaceae bacterium]